VYVLPDEQTCSSLPVCNWLQKLVQNIRREQLTDIAPFLGKGGVVVNEGPDFRVEVQEVPVPEISMHAIPYFLLSHVKLRGSAADF
jgi:hypothetical protein